MPQCKIRPHWVVSCTHKQCPWNKLHCSIFIMKLGFLVLYSANRNFPSGQFSTCHRLISLLICNVGWSPLLNISQQMLCYCKIPGHQLGFWAWLPSSCDTKVQRLCIFCVKEVFSSKTLAELTYLVLNVEKKKKENIHAYMDPSKWNEQDLLIKLYHSENPVPSPSW